MANNRNICSLKNSHEPKSQNPPNYPNSSAHPTFPPKIHLCMQLNMAPSFIYKKSLNYSSKCTFNTFLTFLSSSNNLSFYI